MAKVIKHDGEGSPPAVAPTSAAAAADGREPELARAAEGRRAPVIDRETLEARASAQLIRDRAQAQAEEILQAARQQAAAALDAARDEAERLRQEAQAQGLAAGRDQGAGELSGQILASGQRLQRAEAALAPQLAELATHIARKVLGRELEFAPELVVELVKQALADKARQRREITLRVNPADLAVLREGRAELVEVLSRSKEIGLREDPKVARYGVIIETEAGTIDAQLESQMAAFERVLKQVG